MSNTTAELETPTPQPTPPKKGSIPNWAAALVILIVLGAVGVVYMQLSKTKDVFLKPKAGEAAPRAQGHPAVKFGTGNAPSNMKPGKKHAAGADKPASDAPPADAQAGQATTG